MLNQMVPPPLTLVGISIFMKDPDCVVDLGVSLGRGTNNIAEPFGLGVIFTQLLVLAQSSPHLKKATVFCDSKLALNACIAKKPPVSNRALSVAVKAAYASASKAIPINFQYATSIMVAMKGSKPFPSCLPLWVTTLRLSLSRGSSMRMLLAVPGIALFLLTLCPHMFSSVI